MTSPPRTHLIRPGKIFGQGTVLEEIRMSKGSRTERGFRLECTCGTIYEARLAHLLDGRIQSCGCLNRERARQRLSTKGPRYEAGYRDGENSLIADIRHQFGDAADTMGALLEFFRTITGDPELSWPGTGSEEADT